MRKNDQVTNASMFNLKFIINKPTLLQSMREAEGWILTEKMTGYLHT